MALTPEQRRNALDSRRWPVPRLTCKENGLADGDTPHVLVGGSCGPAPAGMLAALGIISTEPEGTHMDRLPDLRNGAKGRPLSNAEFMRVVQGTGL